MELRKEEFKIVAKIKMAKEIVEITKKEAEVLETRLFFVGGFSSEKIIPEFGWIHEVEVTTAKTKEQIYCTRGFARSEKYPEACIYNDSVENSKEKSILAHFKAVNYFKQIYLNQP